LRKLLAPVLFILMLHFSLAAYSITVTHPNGGEVITTRYVDVNWTTTDFDPNDQVTIYYDTDNNKDNGYVYVYGPVDNTGHFEWDLMQVPDGNYYVYLRITKVSPYIVKDDYSDGDFNKAGFDLLQ